MIHMELPPLHKVDTLAALAEQAQLLNIPPSQLLRELLS